METNEKKYKKEIFDNDLILVNNEIINTNIVDSDPIISAPDVPIHIPEVQVHEAPTKEIPKTDNQEPPKKRGRKTGSTKEVLQAKKQQNVQAPKSNIKQDIDLSQYGQVDVPQSASTEVQDTAQVDISKYISGALLLMMIDFLLPTLFTFVYPKLKRLKDKRKLKMTKDERKELEPIADECIKQVAMKLAPLEAMGLMLLFVYGGKIYELDESDYKPELSK